MRRLLLLIAVAWTVIACEPEPEPVPTEFTAIVCQLDDGPIEHCTSPVSYTGLAPGTHTVTVFATNYELRDGVWGWSETSLDTRTWVVEG